MPTAESVVQRWELRGSTDRRQHHRVILIAPALLDNLKEWSRATCRNVSVGGVSIECDRALAVGERLEIYFELPNGFAVEALVRVVRTDGKETGLRFVRMSRHAFLAIRSHCREPSAAHV